MPGHGQEAVNEAVKKLPLGEVIIATAEGLGETATAGKEGLGGTATARKEGLGETATAGKEASERPPQLGKKVLGRLLPKHLLQANPITERLGTPPLAQVYQIMGRPHG